MRRFTATALSLIIMFSAFGCAADSTATAVSNAEYKVSGSLGGYGAYIADYSSYGFPDAEITVLNKEIQLDFNSSLKADFSVEEEGLYNIAVCYVASKDAVGQLSVGLKIDGEYPFESASKFKLPRTYINYGDKRIDGSGNEFAPEQKEIFEIREYRLSDYGSFQTEPCKFYFSAGTHSIAIDALSLPLTVTCIKICAVEQSLNYSEVSEDYVNYIKYDGDEILIEGEDAIYKSDSDLGAKTDSTDANVYPCDPYVQRINYIGGSNWSDTGDTLYWEITVPKTGLYRLSFHYRQSYILNGNSYRSLMIDGKLPFTEAGMISFPYGNSWLMLTVSDSEGVPYLFYLTEGKHTLSLSVTLGPLAEFCSELEAVSYDIGTMYRQLVMVTGENPDSNRDYNLFSQIPNFAENLETAEKTLRKLASNYEELSGTSGGSTVSILESMANTINSMLKYKYRAQSYKSSFYSNYSSITAAMYDMLNMPLDIDTIVLSGENREIEKGSKGFTTKLAYSTKRFIASFVVDYNNISGDSESDNSITLWINWGRDQAQVLDFLIQSDFTEKTGIPVNLKITNASLVQGILSGNMPDCALQQSRTEPVNLAMRDALYDISKFEDYEDVITRFADNAVKPYEYKGGVYGLPDTQSFQMLFVRTDIFDEMSLETPKTWEDFIGITKILASNNLETGIESVFNVLLYQNGGDLYNSDLNATDLMSDESIAAFEDYTDFFVKYDCPKSFNFYNRFRTGLMPMGIQNYSMYATLKATAPEINGRWMMYELPGTVTADETVNNSAIGTGTACVVLKDTGHEKQAWEFLKWWTDEDVQMQFTNSLESVLGISGRVATATVGTVKRLSWDGQNLTNLLSQWEKVGEFNEVPGSYYVGRSIEQAYWNVIENEKNPRDMLYEWSNVADAEIKRKISQYK